MLQKSNIAIDISSSVVYTSSGEKCSNLHFCTTEQEVLK